MNNANLRNAEFLQNFDENYGVEEQKLLSQQKKEMKDFETKWNQQKEQTLIKPLNRNVMTPRKVNFSLIVGNFQNSKNPSNTVSKGSARVNPKKVKLTNKQKQQYDNEKKELQEKHQDELDEFRKKQNELRNNQVHKMKKKEQKLLQALSDASSKPKIHRRFKGNSKANQLLVKPNNNNNKSVNPILHKIIVKK